MTQYGWYWVSLLQCTKSSKDFPMAPIYSISSRLIWDTCNWCVMSDIQQKCCYGIASIVVFVNNDMWCNICVCKFRCLDCEIPDRILTLKLEWTLPFYLYSMSYSQSRDSRECLFSVHSTAWIRGVRWVWKVDLIHGPKPRTL